MQFVERPLELIKSLQSLDCIPKIHSDMNKLTWDKLESSGEVSHMYTLMPLIVVTYISQQWKQWTFKMLSFQLQLIPLCTSIWFDFNARCCWNFFYPELVRKPLRVELTFTFLLEHSLYWGNESLWLQLTRFVLLEWIAKTDNVSLHQKTNRIQLIKYCSFVSFLFNFVPTLDHNTFAIINTQPSIMQCEHWIKFSRFRHET